MKNMLLIVLCAFFATYAAEARTLYVNAKRPNNKGNGLKVATAKKTIQAAINVAKKGDTILVYPGTYSRIATNNKKITIKSVKGRGKTKILWKGSGDSCVDLSKPVWKYDDANGCYYQELSGNASVLSGFTLDGNGYSIGALVGGTLCNSAIRNVGRKYTNLYPPVIFKSNLSNCLIANNWITTGHLFDQCLVKTTKITNNKSHLDCADPGRFDWGSTFVNCLIENNTLYSFFFHQSTLLNCTVAKNLLAYYSYGATYSESGHFAWSSQFYNCILWNNFSQRRWTEWEEVVKNGVHEEYGYYNQYGEWVRDEDGFDEGYYDNNGAWISYHYQTRTLVGPYTTEEEVEYFETKQLHNVDSGNVYKNTDKANTNPRLTSAYKLKRGSYAINMGKLSKAQKKLVGTKDLAGGKRIKGKAIDLGCYEY